MTGAMRNVNSHTHPQHDCKFNRMLFGYYSNQILSLTVSLTLENLGMESGFSHSWVGDLHLRNGVGSGLNQGLPLSSMEPCGLTGKAPPTSNPSSQSTSELFVPHALLLWEFI